MPLDTLTEIIDALTELKRMHQLNLELLEQISISCDWLLKHNIPIPNAETICSLLKKATILLSEIQADQPSILQYRKLANEKKHIEETNDKETEPYKAVYKQ